MKAKLILVSRLAAVALVLSALVQVEVMAGTGDSGGSISDYKPYILLWLSPLLLSLPYMASVMFLAFRKKSESRALLERLQKLDPAWSPEEIRRQANEAYFKVQESWNKRDPQICRDYVTDLAYQNQKLKTDKLIARHRVNDPDKVHLRSAEVVQVCQSADKTGDHIWVLVKGGIWLYMLDDRDRKPVDRHARYEWVNELWKFSRGKDRWLYAEKSSGLNLLHLLRMRSTSEHLPNLSAD